MSETGKWSSNSKFSLAILCYTISLPTVNKFANEMTYTGGGCLTGLSLLVLILMVVIPSRLMELAVGQYSNRNIVQVWDICPIFRGVGWVALIHLVGHYVIQIIKASKALLFSVFCFQHELPWQSCGHPWVQGNCVEIEDYYAHEVACGYNYTHEECDYQYDVTSLQQFWVHRILKTYNKSFDWELVYCTVGTSVAIFIVTYRNIKSMEKFLWFLFVVPTIQILIIFFWSLINPGGVMGIENATRPDFGVLVDWQHWDQIVRWTMWSGIGNGVYITFGTQSSFRNSLYLRVILITLCELLIAVLCTLTFQNLIGIFCYFTDIEYKEFKESKKDPLIIKSIQGIHYMTDHRGAITFFWLLGIFLLCFRGLVIIVIIFNENLYSWVPKAQKWPAVTSFCIIAILNLLAVTFGSLDSYKNLTTVWDKYSEVILSLMIMIEMYSIVVFYGTTDFMDDFHFMLGIRPPFYYHIHYGFCLVVFTYVYAVTLKDYYTDEDFQAQRLYARITDGVTYGCYVLILVFMVKHVANAINDGYTKKLMCPSPNWGPRDLMLKKSRMIFTSYHITREYMYRQERRRRHLTDIANKNQL